MKHIVGVADMHISKDTKDTIVTHALGSCLGIAVFDPISRLGGLLHAMLPLSTADPEKAKHRPWMYVDFAVPRFFRKIYSMGGQKKRLVVKVAGGARVHKSADDKFAIGKRNFIVLKKLLWKNGVMIESQNVGGTAPRTMYMEIGTGKTWITTAGKSTDL